MVSVPRPRRATQCSPVFCFRHASCFGQPCRHLTARSPHLRPKRSASPEPYRERDDVSGAVSRLRRSTDQLPGFVPGERDDFLLLDPRRLRDAGRVLHHVTAANSLLERDARRPVHEVRGRRLQLLAAHPLRALEQRVQDFPMTCLTWHSSGGS